MLILPKSHGRKSPGNVAHQFLAQLFSDHTPDIILAKYMLDNISSSH
jgi:hypothetical protein